MEKSAKGGVLMEQYRMQEGPLLDQFGSLAEKGFATTLVRDYNRKAISAGKWRIKEWDYYLVMNDRVALALTIDDNGYMGLDSVSFLHFGTKFQHTKSPISLFPMGKRNLPSSSANGMATATGKGYSLSFKAESGRRILDCHMDDFFDGKPLTAHVVLEDLGDDSMVIATPFGKKKAFYYNQKINCMPAEGSVEFDGVTHVFSREDSFGTLDWGRGVWTYHNTWYWSSLSGLVNGHRFGLNLGCGFGDTSAATENMLFYDGTAHKLGDVAFCLPQKDKRPDYLGEWRFHDDDGRLDLRFVPILDRAAKTDVLILKSDQHQVFGKFYGTAVLDDSRTLSLDGLYGFAEQVENKW